MNSKDFNVQANTSTPKRRRLGPGRILRPNNKENNLFLFNHSPINRQLSSTKNEAICQSPPLPSNQIEFLHDSRNSSSCPSSPCLFESLLTSNLDDLSKNGSSANNNVSEFEDISDEMFQSRMEQESSQVVKQESDLEKQTPCINGSSSPNLDASFISGRKMLDLKLNTNTYENGNVDKTIENDVNDLLTSKCEKSLRDNIEESFELINQSICDMQDETNKNDRSSLFETHDSFLLDIKVSGITSKDMQKVDGAFVKPKAPMEIKVNNKHFYGLPKITESLFKSYRNIEKFYGWYC